MGDGGEVAGADRKLAVVLEEEGPVGGVGNGGGLLGRRLDRVLVVVDDVHLAAGHLGSFGAVVAAMQKWAESGSSKRMLPGDFEGRGDAVEVALSPVGIWAGVVLAELKFERASNFFFHWQAGKVGKTWDPGASPVWATHVKPHGGPLTTTWGHFQEHKTCRRHWCIFSSFDQYFLCLFLCFFKGRAEMKEGAFSAIS